MDYFTEIAAKLQDALNAIDNFEASNSLNADQMEAWLQARDSILSTMGAAVALEMTVDAD